MNNPTPPPAPPKEPIKDGIATHNRRIGELIDDLGKEIVALQRLEKSLKDAHDRLDRHTNLMGMETQLIDQLLKRDSKLTVRPDLNMPTPIKAVTTPAPTPSPFVPAPLDKLADKVEADLKDFASLQHPVGFTSKR